MNVLVCGLGSMGQRRIRLMQAHYGAKINIFGVDNNAERRENSNKLYSIKTYESIIDCVKNNKIEFAFVCAAPLAHYSIIMECLSYGINVFTELNVVSDGYEQMQKSAQEKGCKLFLSSTMLYRNDINYIIDKVRQNKKCCSYSYHVGQYLPDWHPWEKINNFFVTNKRTNGCREIFAVQMPWILKCFGEVEGYKVETNNLSDLKINFPDTFSVQLKHKNGNVGNIMFDIVSRKPITNLEIIANDYYISWKGEANSLNDFDIVNKADNFIQSYDSVEQDSRYSKSIIENAYLAEIIAFFDYCNIGKLPCYTFDDDKITLNLLDELEK